VEPGLGAFVADPQAAQQMPDGAGVQPRQTGKLLRQKLQGPAGARPAEVARRLPNIFLHLPRAGSGEAPSTRVNLQGRPAPLLIRPAPESAHLFRIFRLTARDAHDSLFLWSHCGQFVVSSCSGHRCAKESGMVQVNRGKQGIAKNEI